MKTETASFPQLYIVGQIADQLESALPLEHTDVQAQITGLAAAVRISQRFRNPLTEKVDLEYLFPLPHDAAVTGFELQAGERVIRASVQEIALAREQYQQARQKGQRASLLDQRRPNLFAIQLANIQPGEFIQAVTTYQQRIEVLENAFEFVFPMGITPKYHRPGKPEEAQGVDAPVTLDRSQVGDVEISVEIETGLQGGEPVSPSHALIVRRTGSSGFAVRLDGAHLPDHDFVLRWRAHEETLRMPAWMTAGKSAQYFMATFNPPPANAEGPVIPREYIFVLDRSGSMSGQPIRQAVNALRACLRTLNPQDSFGILLFDDRLDWLLTIKPVSQDAVNRADHLLETVEGRGGTDILPALQSALGPAIDPRRARLVIFLTDGAVSAEAHILKHACASLGTARLFTFGIGPSVNRALLEKLAKYGRGEATFIGLDEDIEEAIMRFQDRIAFPLWTNLSLRVEGGTAWDIYPAQLPDLYAGRPLEVLGKFSGAEQDSRPVILVAEGERGGERLEIRSVLSQQAPDPALLPRLWARARIEDVSERAEMGLQAVDAARDAIIPLAIENGLLTRYTAFLVVDSDSPASPGRSTVIQVAQPLPEELTYAGAMPPSARMFSIAPSPMNASANMMVTESAPKDFEWTSTGKSLRAAEPGFGVDEDGMLMPTVMKTPAPDAKALLKELARRQQLDGSWEKDVEISAAALLAYLRNGQTPHKGFYRKQLQRAFAWLAKNNGSGFAQFLRALALKELAGSGNDPKHTQAFSDALQTLPKPAGALQKAISNLLKGESLPVTDNAAPQDMDELRLAAAAGSNHTSIPRAFLAETLGLALAACLADVTVK